MYVFSCVILFLCFLFLLVLRLPRLGKSELILVLFVRFWSISACLDLSVSSSSWGLRRAAVCDCGTSWTFLLPCFSPSFLRLETVNMIYFCIIVNFIYSYDNHDCPDNRHFYYIRINKI